ncbi:MAG: hypothetical protein Q9200_003432 [Gallowayella weberi]
MRSSPFGSAGLASQDVEALGGPPGAREGDDTSKNCTLASLAHLGRRWHRRLHRAKTWASSSDTCVEGCDADLEKQSVYQTARDQDMPNDSFTTVKLRRHTRSSGAGWDLNRHDVERATHTQLLAPTAVGRLMQLFRRPSLESTCPTSSGETENAFQIETLGGPTRTRPTLHLLPHGRSIPENYHTFQDSHHISTTLADGHHDINNQRPSRRIRTWTYGLDDPGRDSMSDSSTTSAEVDDGTRAQSTSTSFANSKIASLERFSSEEPTVYIPRTRRETKSSPDITAAAAESMSIISVPFHGRRRVSGVSVPEEAPWDPQGYGAMRELDAYEDIGDADSFGSVASASASWSLGSLS